MQRRGCLSAILALASAVASQARGAPPADTAAPPVSSVDEVVVTGQTPQTRTLLDRKTYAVTSDLQATAGTAADVLGNVPSVSVDADGNVSLRGDSNVTILVDGKPSAQFSGASRGPNLQQFSASDIERIEVLTTPPAQYKAEGSGGVINIITKKTRTAGLSGSGQYNLGDQRRYVAGLTGAYNAGPLKLSGAFGLRQDARERLTTTDRVVLDPSSNSQIASTQSLDEHQTRLTPSAKLSVDYDLNERQAVGLSLSHRELSGNRYFNQHDTDAPLGGALADISDRHDDGKDWSINTSEGLRFDQKLWRPNETLSLGLQRSAEHEREGNAYRNTFALPFSAPTFDELHVSHDLVKTEFNADYDLPLAKGRELRLGYDLEHDQNAFDPRGGTIDPATGQITDDPNVTNHFRYRQTVQAAYAQYETLLGAWDLQTGVRLESAKATTLQITGDIPGGRSDFGLYPSLHLNRALGDDGKLALGVSRRLTRPDPEILNPFADHQDTHNLRAGNPNLAPQDTWSYEAGYEGLVRALTYGVTAYYRFDRNSVTDIVQPISDDVVLTTKANLPKSRSAGLEFTARGKLGADLAYNLSGDLFSTQIDATALGATGLRSTAGFNLKASLDWRPTAADTTQISLSRTDRRLTPQGSVGAINLVNLGFKHQLRPNLAAVVTVTDALDGQRLHRLITTPQLRDDYLRNQFGRLAYVGVVYTFGGATKAKSDGFDYQP
jgi:outer membrane receptor protein involved in Fe transport